MPDVRVAANWGAGPERREAFAARFGSRALDSIEAVCADPEVDLVVVSLPNHLHVEAVRLAAAHGKGVACTKPLGRNAAEAGEMVRLVEDAGVYNAYLENVVFTVETIRMREMIESGAIGRLTTFRAREGHSGPHAPHFWNAELAGGGALLDMGSHGAEAARYLFGKDVAGPRRVRLGRDARPRRQDGPRGQRGHARPLRGRPGRDDGRLVVVQGRPREPLRGLRRRRPDRRGHHLHDALRAFIERPAGYLGEKVDADTGWVFPVPDEPYAHGHDAMMRHVVESFRDGVAPRETFRDGFVVNAIIDAAYRSMRSGSWEAVAAVPGGSRLT